MSPARRIQPADRERVFEEVQTAVARRALFRMFYRLQHAEGVETSEQAEALAGMGCEQAQGFHYGRPLPAADFVAAWAGAMNRASGSAP